MSEYISWNRRGLVWNYEWFYVDVHVSFLTPHPQDDEKVFCTLTKIQICQDQVHMWTIWKGQLKSRKSCKPVAMK